MFSQAAGPPAVALAGLVDVELGGEAARPARRPSGPGSRDEPVRGQDEQAGVAHADEHHQA